MHVVHDTRSRLVRRTMSMMLLAHQVSMVRLTWCLLAALLGCGGDAGPEPMPDAMASPEAECCALCTGDCPSETIDCSCSAVEPAPVAGESLVAEGDVLVQYTFTGAFERPVRTRNDGPVFRDDAVEGGCVVYRPDALGRRRWAFSGSTASGRSLEASTFDASASHLSVQYGDGYGLEIAPAVLDVGTNNIERQDGGCATTFAHVDGNSVAVGLRCDNAPGEGPRFFEDLTMSFLIVLRATGCAMAESPTE